MKEERNTDGMNRQKKKKKKEMEEKLSSQKTLLRQAMHLI